VQESSVVVLVVQILPFHFHFIKCDQPMCISSSTQKQKQNKKFLIVKFRIIAMQEVTARRTQKSTTLQFDFFLSFFSLIKDNLSEETRHPVG